MSRFGRYATALYARIGRVEFSVRPLWWPSIGVGLLGYVEAYSSDDDHNGHLRPAIQVALLFLGVRIGVVHEECFGWCDGEHDK